MGVCLEGGGERKGMGGKAATTRISRQVAFVAVIVALLIFLLLLLLLSLLL